MAKLVALTLAVCAVSLVVSFPANNFGLRYHKSKHEDSRDSWSDVIPYRGRGAISESRQAKVESAEESDEDSAESAAYLSVQKTEPVAPALPADVSDEALNELVPEGHVAATKDLANQAAAQQEDQFQSVISQPVETVAIAAIAEPVRELAVEQDRLSEPSKDAPLPVAEIGTPTQTDDKVDPQQGDQVFIKETVLVSNLPEAADEPKEPTQPAPEQLDQVIVQEIVQVQAQAFPETSDDAPSPVADDSILTRSETNVAAEQAVRNFNQETVQQEFSSLPEASDPQAVPVGIAETVAAAVEAVEQSSLAEIVVGEPQPVVILPLSDELRESLQSVPSEGEPNATFDDAASTEPTVVAFDEAQPAAVDGPSHVELEDVTELIQAKSAGSFDGIVDEAQVEQDTAEPDLARDEPVTDVNDEQDDSTEPSEDVDVNSRNALAVLSEESQTEIASDSTEDTPPAEERQEMFNYHKGPVEEAESTTVTFLQDDHTQFEGSEDNLAARNNAAAELADDSTAEPSEDVSNDAETATDFLQDEATDSPATEPAARSALDAADENQAADVTVAADEETTTENI